MKECMSMCVCVCVCDVRDTDFLSKLVKTYLETEKLVKP